MPAELGAKKAAQAYEEIVSGVVFDVVMLGMGEDGHTASLFPGHSHEAEASQLVQTEFDSPKPPAERVTLSAQCLGNSRYLFKIVTGAGKKEAVKQWLSGMDLPIATVRGEQTTIFISEDSLP
jgi:6-phosphogluconolactonase